MQPFLAMIVPMGSPSGPVDPGYSPPWATPGPGRPPAGPVDPGYSPPWAQAPVDPGYSPPWARPQPPRPTHPIFYPPGTQPHPDQGLPGSQPYPDHTLPGDLPRPSHPIYIPAPPTEPPSPPLVIWGGPYFPLEPTHPIELPPEVVPPPVEGQPKIEWKTAWTPQTGWIVVGIPAEGTLVPTPSK